MSENIFLTSRSLQHVGSLRLPSSLSSYKVAKARIPSPPPGVCFCITRYLSHTDPEVSMYQCSLMSETQTYRPSGDAAQMNVLYCNWTLIKDCCAAPRNSIDKSPSCSKTLDWTNIATPRRLYLPLYRDRSWNQKSPNFILDLQYGQTKNRANNRVTHLSRLLHNRTS